MFDVKEIKCFSPFPFFIILFQLIRFDHSLWISFLEFEPILPPAKARTVIVVIHTGMGYTMSSVQQCDTSAVTSVIWERKQQRGKDHITKFNPRFCNGFTVFFTPSATLMKAYKKPLEISLGIKLDSFSG